MSTFFNLEARRNCDLVFDFILVDEDGVTPIDIANYEFFGAVEDGTDAELPAVFDITLTKAVDTTTGKVTATFARADLFNLTQGQYKYEILQQDSNNIRTPCLEGNLNLERGIYDNV